MADQQTQQEKALQRATELHQQYQQIVIQSAAKVVDGILAQKPPDTERELNARRWAALRVVFLDAGFSYDEGVVLAKALAAGAVKGEWPHDAEAVGQLALTSLVGLPPKSTMNLYGLMVMVRKYTTRLTGSPYDSHEFAVLSISRRLRQFIKQCEEQGLKRELVANDLAAASELQPEMVYRVETAGKRITAPMLLRLDRALRRAEAEAANG